MQLSDITNEEENKHIADPMEGMFFKTPFLSNKKKKKLDRLLEIYTGEGKFEKEFLEFGEASCCICCEDYNEEAVIRKLIKCGHIFHSNCLNNWFILKLKDPKCPLCNVNIKEQ